MAWFTILSYIPCPFGGLRALIRVVEDKCPGFGLQHVGGYGFVFCFLAVKQPSAGLCCGLSGADIMSGTVVADIAWRQKSLVSACNSRTPKMNITFFPLALPLDVERASPRDQHFFCSKSWQL